jgi:transposase
VPMLEGKVDAFIEVDTHRDRHAAAILDRNGGLVAQLEVSTDQAGYATLLSFVADHAPGRRCWALEGTGCYGAGLASFLLDQGEWVVEVDRPKRPRGRTGAKSDPLNAIRAGPGRAQPRAPGLPAPAGQREALRVLQLTCSGAVKVSADARRHLKALLVTAPEPLRAGLRRGTWLRQAQACAVLVAAASDPVEHRATVRALRLTAERALAAHQEARQLGRSCGRWSRRWRRRCWPNQGWGRSRRPAADQLVAPGVGCAQRPRLPCWPASPRSRPPLASWSAIGSTGAGTGS